MHLGSESRCNRQWVRRKKEHVWAAKVEKVVNVEQFGEICHARQVKNRWSCKIECTCTYIHTQREHACWYEMGAWINAREEDWQRWHAQIPLVNRAFWCTEVKYGFNSEIIKCKSNPQCNMSLWELPYPESHCPRSSIMCCKLHLSKVFGRHPFQPWL